MTFFLSLAPLWVNTEGEHCENHQLPADLQMVRTHLVTILDTFRHSTLFFLGGYWKLLLVRKTALVLQRAGGGA